MTKKKPMLDHHNSKPALPNHMTLYAGNERRRSVVVRVLAFLLEKSAIDLKTKVI